MNNMTAGSSVTDESTPRADELLRTVLDSAQLPSLPTVASRLLTLTAREDTTLAEVAELVSRDVALCTKILKVANSAFYSFPQQICSISQAVSMLGTSAVQSLVLSFSFMSMNRVAQGSRFRFDTFMERSLARASMAKLIAESLCLEDVEEVFIAGLLENLGELVMACTVPEQYDKVLDKIEGDPERSCEAEVAVFGMDHCFIGYEVAQHWSFPSRFTLPILHHHNPRAYDGNDEKVRQFVRIVYMSDLLVNILYTDNPERYHARFREEGAKLLGLTSEQMESILQSAHTAIDQAAVNFGLQVAHTRPVQEILQEANIRLSLLNLDYEQMNKQLIRAKLDLEHLTRELREKNELLQQMADLDGLTGIYNNRYFQQALDNELNRTIRHGYSMSLVLADIDHFKHFNDDYGHLVGDFVITEFSRLLAGNLRQYDTLARYGGEEFVIVLPETTLEQAAAVAEKLREIVEKAVFVHQGQSYRVTASFGVASVSGSDELVPQNNDLIKMADDALYVAKDKGRNCVSVHGERKKKWFRVK
ncbi:MAG: GGDEF domain-containing protein [Halioglobus sp.]|nr:GGDEF domain-containing protein [Halioglobus sp.]